MADAGRRHLLEDHVTVADSHVSSDHVIATGGWERHVIEDHVTGADVGYVSRDHTMGTGGGKRHVIGDHVTGADGVARRLILDSLRRSGPRAGIVCDAPSANQPISSKRSSLDPCLCP